MSNKQGYDINQDIVAPNSIRESPLLETARIKLDNLVSLVSLFTKLALNTSDLMLDECFLLPNQVRIPQLQFVPSRTMIALPLLPYISLQLICETFKFRLQIPIVESDVLATELEVTLVADINAFEGKISQVILELKEHLAGEIEFYKKAPIYFTFLCCGPIHPSA
ncbi:mediator complex, 95kD-subunit [Culex quinquefasciatus]|uniref:Mediator complex, 95kD-subunit n=1 Tax=Culex quinquefasciatus TaxID=7176 RepID=B0WHC1_CULQU|nr:mediator complex, 95kD-subunit [Culex quinquefasciatus]|eukprot:XP_001848105.1 mediator complex, 95kD-subunit [Culex quinquefasciatus]